MSDSEAATIVLHYLNKSRSFRILWLLEELGLSYQLKKYNRQADWTAPPELKKVHHLGKAPVLEDGGVVITESGAIVEYLITKYGPQFKPSEEDLIDTLTFTHLAEGSLGSVLSSKILWEVAPSRAPFIIRPILSAVSTKIIALRLQPVIDELLSMIENQLEKNSGNDFLCGPHLTSADLMITYFLDRSLAFTQLPKFGPNTQDYVDRMKRRVAYQLAIEKGEQH